MAMRLRRAEQHVGLRQRLAQLDLAVAIHVDAEGDEVVIAAPEGRLGHVVVEAAGAVQDASIGQRDLDVEGVDRIVLTTGAGIDPDVVVGQ